ncbi:hypothetical protein M3Y96_00147600 [Aphelenchoides besseyi]|nr:hypothetical protein M3Y96_00147600 [Aphelenchoides besseyi]
MFNSIESLVGSENKSAPNHKVTGVQKTGDSVKQPENPSPFDFGSHLPIQQQFSTPNFFSSSMFYNPLALTLGRIWDECEDHEQRSRRSHQQQCHEADEVGAVEEKSNEN